MTFEEYVRKAEAAFLANPGYRYGQACFNTLYQFRPDLSEQIRTTKLDPFYRDDSESLLDFFYWLQEHWKKE